MISPPNSGRTVCAACYGPVRYSESAEAYFHAEPANIVSLQTIVREVTEDDRTDAAGLPDRSARSDDHVREHIPSRKDERSRRDTTEGKPAIPDMDTLVSWAPRYWLSNPNDGSEAL
jgi:hypothetical protein